MINFFESISRISEELSEIRASLGDLRTSVESLQANPIVEVWAPVLSIVSSIGVAYLAARISAKATLKSAKEGTRASELVKTERAKIDAANDWITSFERALRNVYGILETCQTIKSTNPLERLLQVQRLEDSSLLLKKDVTTLFPFIQNRGEKTLKKWQQPSYVDSICLNYNQLLNHCANVTKTIESMRAAVFARVPKEAVGVDLTAGSMIKLFGCSMLGNVSASLETSINLAKSLAIEFEDFQTKFPDIAKSKLVKEDWITELMPKVLSNHGTFGGRSIKDFNIVEVSVEELAQLLGKPVEETRSIINPNIGLEDDMPLLPDEE